MKHLHARCKSKSGWKRAGKSADHPQDCSLSLPTPNSISVWSSLFADSAAHARRPTPRRCDASAGQDLASRAPAMSRQAGATDVPDLTPLPDHPYSRHTNPDRAQRTHRSGGGGDGGQRARLSPGMAGGVVTHQEDGYVRGASSWAPKRGRAPGRRRRSGSRPGGAGGTGPIDTHEYPPTSRRDYPEAHEAVRARGAPRAMAGLPRHRAGCPRTAPTQARTRLARTRLARVAPGAPLPAPRVRRQEGVIWVDPAGAVFFWLFVDWYWSLWCVLALPAIFSWFEPKESLCPRLLHNFTIFFLIRDFAILPCGNLVRAPRGGNAHNGFTISPHVHCFTTPY